MKTVEIPIKIARREGRGKSKFIFNFRSHLRILRLLRNKDKLTGPQNKKQ